MGNFHCIPDGCAEVRYQPYEKSGGVRYRYPGEDWQTVDGDDYKIIDQREGQCPNTSYRLTYIVEQRAGGSYEIGITVEGILLNPFHEYTYFTYVSNDEEITIVTSREGLNYNYH